MNDLPRLGAIDVRGLAGEPGFPDRNAAHKASLRSAGRSGGLLAEQRRHALSRYAEQVTDLGDRESLVAQLHRLAGSKPGSRSVEDVDVLGEQLDGARLRFLFDEGSERSTAVELCPKMAEAISHRVAAIDVGRQGLVDVIDGAKQLSEAVVVGSRLQDVVKSIVGALVRAASGAYAVGDRVQIGGLRGQVIDHSLLSTTLIEVSEGHTRSGRTIIVPNSLLLTEPVRNETAGHQYILHTLRVPVSTDRWREAHETLFAAANEVSRPYVQPAREQMELRAKRHAINPPNVEPFVTARPTSSGDVDVLVRVPVAAHDVWRVEDQIVRAWLDRVDEAAAT